MTPCLWMNFSNLFGGVGRNNNSIVIIRAYNNIIGCGRRSRCRRSRLVDRGWGGVPKSVMSGYYAGKDWFWRRCDGSRPRTPPMTFPTHTNTHPPSTNLAMIVVQRSVVRGCDYGRELTTTNARRNIITCTYIQGDFHKLTPNAFIAIGFWRIQIIFSPFVPTWKRRVSKNTIFKIMYIWKSQNLTLKTSVSFSHCIIYDIYNT